MQLRGNLQTRKDLCILKKQTKTRKKWTVVFGNEHLEDKAVNKSESDYHKSQNPD